ncbi:MAG: fructose-6-phosphate aldolase [Bacilli bacterium]|nr:fructose-6-phosphate aldolase [Bacilli bacterium]
MKIFIDTANLNEIKEASSFPFVDGVTTNPSLIAKEGRDLVSTIKEITTLIDGPISAEVKEDNATNMYKEAKEYAKMHKNIVIKVPMTLEGMKLTKMLSKEGIKTNVTLIFTPAQAILAAKCGATYVSPFMGRLDDITKGTGVELISEVRYLFDLYGFDTEIIAASIRSLDHVHEALHAGAHVATIPYKVILKMLEHPLTTKGLEIFKEASK